MDASTGCFFVSTFSGRIKVSALKLVIRGYRLHKAKKGLGKHLASLIRSAYFVARRKAKYVYASQTTLCSMKNKKMQIHVNTLLVKICFMQSRRIIPAGT